MPYRSRRRWRTSVLGPVLREAVAVFHVAVEVEPTVGIAEAPGLLRLGKSGETGVDGRTCTVRV